MRGAHLAVAAVTAVAAFLAGRWVLEDLANGAARTPLPLAPLPAEGREDLTVTAADGTLERSAAGGAFVALQRGEVLAVGDDVRVGGADSAVLRLGVASHVTLSHGATLTVTAITPRELSLQLGGGRAHVDLAHPGRTLRLVTTEGAEVLADGSERSRFLVVKEPGRLSVANEATPAVRLRASHEEMAVPAGFTSWSIAGGAPATPIVPPQDPGLELAEPAVTLASAAATDDESGSEPAVVVHGRAHPLARVRVNGQDVTVREDGGFSAPLNDDASWPAQVLASLPTGIEALLEVSLPEDLVTRVKGDEDGNPRVKKRSKKRKRALAKKRRSSRRGR